MSEAIAKLADEVIEALKPKLETELLAIAERLKSDEGDPLLTMKAAARELGMSETSMRLLVQAGHIEKAPGLVELRVRRSELRKYGTKQP